MDATGPFDTEADARLWTPPVLHRSVTVGTSMAPGHEPDVQAAEAAAEPGLRGGENRAAGESAR